ncbi:MAG: MBL fold metallo-hydrolase, partial [Gemmatimonadota bacterium]|nr:MBL fold metallo-hydrolase [Gemmatimonadota bacterium]
DMEGEFTVGYLAPDRVRLVNADAPPDVEFRGTLAADEARSIRRIDPRRLLEELDRHPEWVVDERPDGWRDVRWPGAEALASIRIRDGRLASVRTTADLPLRGRVPVVWNWTGPADGTGPALELRVDGRPLFRATGSRRRLPSEEADRLWEPSGGESPIEVPGKAWPSVVNMRVETLDPGVHIVRGVRTGFHHLVVETREGLVVADAPAGWVEQHQVPPADLVPGLGISGLSERFIDFLRRQWPGVPIRAVALTHLHDDHAGGARAFAAAGAEVYAPADVADFLETALNRASMPSDRLSGTGRKVRVIGVEGRLALPDPERPVELISMGRNPHVDAALGVQVPSASIFFQSDLHVPTTEAPTPRADRLETDCWFAVWATASLPPETELHNSHTATTLSVEAVAAYLAHEACDGTR